MVATHRARAASPCRSAGPRYHDEYVPVVDALREAGLIDDGTEANAYLRVSCDRYMLLRTHEWGERVIARLREEI